MSGKSLPLFGPEATSSSVPSDQRDPKSAVVSMSCATTKNRCTNNSASGFVWRRVRRNCTKLHLGPRNSFFIATAASNDCCFQASTRISSGSVRTCRRDRRAPHTVRPRFRKRCEIHRLQTLYLEAALREQRRNIPSEVQTFEQPIG